MRMPEFFDAVPLIGVRDPLAKFLGAAEDGLIDYRYADVVRLAGHSCPTVAAAFLMTRAGLASIFSDTRAERGAIRVEFREDRLDGATGVMANVASFITGATQDAGFKGIAGRFDRRGLLHFGRDLTGQIRFSRTDTGATATVSARLDSVPGDERIARLLPRCLSGAASTEESALFRSLWQARVRALIERADDPEVIVVHR